MKNNNTPQHATVLAVDPTVRGMGYVVMEGPDDVIDWGTSHVHFRKNRFVERKVTKLIEFCSPDVLIIEDAADGRRCARVNTLLASLEQLAMERGLEVVKVSHGNVLQTFSNFDVSTKHAIARKLVEFYPQLDSMLPGKRKIWESEDGRYGIFDAAALGFAHYYLQQD